MGRCFENRITSGDDISAGHVDRYVGLNAHTDELASISEAVVFGTDASGAAVRQFGYESFSVGHRLSVAFRAYQNVLR